MSGKDYWFHATEYTGAHVIVKGDPTGNDAAQLAATHSKSKEPYVSVGMCRGIARNHRHFIVSKM